MSEKNCCDLSKQPDVDGFLVGGASLKPACEFSICKFSGSTPKVHRLNLVSCRYHQRQAKCLKHAPSLSDSNSRLETGIERVSQSFLTASDS